MWIENIGIIGCWLFMKNIYDIVEELSKTKTCNEIKDLIQKVDEDWRVELIDLSEEDWPILSSAVAKQKGKIENISNTPIKQREHKKMQTIAKVIGEVLDISSGKARCPFHKENTASLNIWPDTDSFYCFGCGAGGDSIAFVRKYYDWGFKRAVQHIENLTGETLGFINEAEYDLVATEFNDDIHTKLKEITSTDGRGFRGLKKEVTMYFGVRHEFSTDTGEVIKQYYPCTVDGHLSGYKIRKVPKSFDHVGVTGKEADLFGWFRFAKVTGKYCLVACGEIDTLSAYQMLKEYTDSKGQQDYGYIPCVSSTLGESNISQFQEQYSWFDGFTNIIIAADNDEAGEKAANKLAKILPKGKVYIMQHTLKDCNEYLVSGKQKEWINLFFKAKQYTPAGIISSSNLMDSLVGSAEVLKITLPPFLAKASKMLAGGFRLNQIINICASTSIGKTTLINAVVKHILFNSPYLVGVISLEAGINEYSQGLLSEHIGRKLSLIEDGEELKELLLTEEVQEKANELFRRPDGSPRFYLLDDQGDTGSLEDMITQLVISCNVSVILLDPLSDYFASKSVEEQEGFMAFQKKMIKAHDITFLNVVHLRKAAGGQKDGGRGASQDESQMYGSSSISKSAHVNIFLERDKYNEDEIIRNTTKVVIAKNRVAGTTGDAGEIYYCGKTHRLWDKEEWMLKENKQF